MRSSSLSRRRMLRGLSLASAATAAGAVLESSGRPTQPLARAAEPQRRYLPQVPVQLPFPRPRNFIVILCDTLRYDHIGFNGNTWIRTPNLDAFARQALVFDKAYAGGFPTLPNRCELFAGRYTYTYLGWDQLGPQEVVLAQALHEAGYITGMIFDTPHIKGQGRTLERGFDSWEWTRGQEDDRWRATPLDPLLPADPTKLRKGAEVVTQYLRNVAERQSEADWFVSRNMLTAIAWLRRTHAAGKFLLYIDNFDPHEPWDPPRSYVDLYDPGYTGQEVIYPRYSPPDYLTAAERRHMAALYAAEVTLVDYWLGQLFDELTRLNLWQNTAVILLSDHGALLGEHNAIGKAWDRPEHYECWPFYQELAHIPLMMRLPGVPPRRTDALAQPTDLMPTILQLAGATDPGTMQAKSLVPVIADLGGAQRTAVHDIVVTSRSLSLPASVLPRVTVNDGEWAFMCGPAGVSPRLYHLPTDPAQAHDVLASNCSRARDLHGRLIAFWQSIGVAEAILSAWRPPPC